MENEQKIQLEKVQNTIHNSDKAVNCVTDAITSLGAAITALSDGVTICEVLHGSEDVMASCIVLHNIEKQLRQLV